MKTPLLLKKYLILISAYTAILNNYKLNKILLLNTINLFSVFSFYYSLDIKVSPVFNKVLNYFQMYNFNVGVKTFNYFLADKKKKVNTNLSYIRLLTFFGAKPIFMDLVKQLNNVNYFNLYKLVALQRSQKSCNYIQKSITKNLIFVNLIYKNAIYFMKMGINTITSYKV